MTFAKSLCCAAGVLTLAAGAAFAGEDFSTHGSVENSPPLLSDPLPMPEESIAMTNSSVESSPPDVIYIYPVEVTEYYLIVPSDSSELPG